VGLASQWERISRALPRGWESVELRLLIPDRAARSRAAALLGPLAVGRFEEELRFTVSRSSGVGPDAAGRLLANLDDENLSGTLVLARTAAAAAAAPAARPLLETQWDELVAALPADWSDLLCRLTLASSDDVPRAALLAAPVNPSRPAKDVGFDFRVARTAGYGASAQMTRRCLVRLDDAGIPGSVEVLHALSDTHHVSTQGPVWVVDGKTL
jgi:hypothetical protein